MNYQKAVRVVSNGFHSINIERLINVEQSGCVQIETYQTCKNYAEKSALKSHYEHVQYNINVSLVS